MENITDAIANAYFADNGFRSVQHTYKQAKAENPAVTLKHVKDWFDRTVARRTNLRGYNSLRRRARRRQQYQADLFFMTSGADVYKRKRRKDIVEVIDADKPAILMTDIFSKITKVLLIDDKKPNTILAGIRKLFDMMGGKPEVLYTDEEGSFLSNLVKQGMEDDDVRLFATRGRAPFAERQIRTVKDMIVKRLQYSGSRVWRDQDFMNQVTDTYNNEYVHRTTGMTPYQGKQPWNRQNVKASLGRRTERRTGPIRSSRSGTRSRCWRRRSSTRRNSVPIWSDKTYKVEDIGTDYQMDQTVYYTDHRPEPLLAARAPESSSERKKIKSLLLYK
jgi:hypothetical protein